MAPTLVTSTRGRFSGSITTRPNPASAKPSTCSRLSSEVTTISPSRPAALSRLAHESGAATGPSAPGIRPTTTSTPASAPASVTPRSSSSEYGLTSSSKTRSITRAGVTLRRPTWGTYPSSRTASSTRALVAVATSPRPLRTFDAVGRETPAASATIASVARRVVSALPDTATSLMFAEKFHATIHQTSTKSGLDHASGRFYCRRPFRRFFPKSFEHLGTFDEEGAAWAGDGRRCSRWERRR